MATRHVVRTTHIQRLIENGLDLARRAGTYCNYGQGGTHCEVPITPLEQNPPANRVRYVPVEHALQKAAADLRHAAEELEAERLSCLGWAQV